MKYSSPLYPSTENIRTMMGVEFSGLRPQDTAVFSFAGYEVQREGDNDYYFMTGDGDNEDPATLVSLSEVYRVLLQSGAGSGIVFIDACRHAETSTPLSPPPGIAVFFSCSRGEFAIESADSGTPSGLFTDSLVAAMKGAADLNRDGKVAWEELTAYVTREVARRAALLGTTSQVPELFGTPRLSPVFAVPAAETPAPDPLLPNLTRISHTPSAATGCGPPPLRSGPDFPWTVCTHTARREIWSAPRGDASSRRLATKGMRNAG